MRGAFAHERFSRGEEIAHAITHGLGALGSAAGLVVLVVQAVQQGDVRLLVGVTVFGAAMFTLYAASTLYHALTATRAKRVFKLLDHGAIYLLIAGTYTPFCLITLGGGWGWTLFGLAWGLAILGIVYEVVLGRPWRRLSLVFYLALGWLIVIAVKPLMAALPSQALQWLLFGGLAYTGGAVFYAWRGFPYHHAIWHLWVLAGTGLHYAAVLKYVIPAG
ncbi:MAG: hemolysin III family protein [Candidatus Krumholzibacteria bacterium]|nr:hemolysin III family protein [Candidatus Krumholzibacteria bacterium]